MTSPAQVEATVSPPELDGTATRSRTVQEFLKDVGLFFAAPFITLGYLLLFPFIAAMLLLRSGRRVRRRR